MQIRQFLIAVCIGMMFAACSSSDDYFANEDDTIRLTAQIQTLKTRVSENGTALQNSGYFVNGEQINVYIKDANTNNDVEGVPESGYVVYSAFNTGFWETTSAPKFPESGAVDIYALYPSTVKITDESFSVQTNQTTEADYRASDLMCAIASNKQKNDGVINLSFNHCLSKVILKVKKGDTTIDDEDIFNTAIDNVYKTVALSQSMNNEIVLGNLSNKGHIYMDGTDISKGYTAIVIPQTIPAGTELFSLSAGGVGLKCITNKEIVLEPGCVHTITLTADFSGVSITDCLVSGWTSGTQYNHDDQTAIPM